MSLLDYGRIMERACQLAADLPLPAFYRERSPDVAYSAELLRENGSMDWLRMIGDDNNGHTKGPAVAVATDDGAIVRIELGVVPYPLSGAQALVADGAD